MKRKKWINLLVPEIVLFILISGCATQMEKFGEVLPQPKGEKQMTIEMLQENWQDYFIYQDGPLGGVPIAIMFDPRNDDKTLATHRWDEIKDKKSLSDAIGWIKTKAEIPHVMRIMGPNDQIFGYVYTYNESIPLHVINDKKIFVDDIVN
jgi:heme/copper-type cytochrome/quinol oxidase subunit 2